MSLRQRNRTLAMRAAQSAALDLFEREGFDAVAVEVVAAESGMSPSTLYRHFGTKEALVLWDECEGNLDRHLGDTLGKRPPLEAVREAVLRTYSDLEPDELRLQHRRGALIDQTPALLAAMAGQLQAGRLELQQALNQVYGKRHSELELELTARVALEAWIAGFEAWQRKGLRSSLPDAIRDAFRALRRVL